MVMLRGIAADTAETKRLAQKAAEDSAFNKLALTALNERAQELSRRVTAEDCVAVSSKAVVWEPKLPIANEEELLTAEELLDDDAVELLVSVDHLTY